ncbi:MAG: MFS transporter [Gammaproteobacteria bacterium]
MPRIDSPGPMTTVERRVTAALAAVFAMRMLGLFVVLPVLAVHAVALEGATPLLIGLAIGTYGLMQGILQIPFGMLSDRYGRKPMIVLGLVLFAAGGLLAAWSDSIWGVIVGRALQGCGAISGVVMALLADATRETHRARAMAAIGITIGLSFGLAMVLGPLVVAGAGLSGLFLFTSLMAVASLMLVLGVVPTPAVVPQRGGRRLWPRLVRVARHPGLFRLDLGVFLLHLVMVAVFVVIPPALVRDAGLPVASHWKVYLPVVLVSILAMAPVLMRAERRGRVREAVLLGGVGIVLSLLVMAVAAGNLWLLVAGLLLYFVAFNLLEAAMPAMVSRVGPTWSRGAAMGVYSSSQFMGAFAGGLVGGGLASVLPPQGVLMSCALLFAGWVVFARTLRNARNARGRGPEAGVP